MHRFSKFLMGMALALGTAAAPWAVAAPGGDSGSGAYLGVMVEKVSPEVANALHLTSGGTAITNVDQDGPACRAGLKGGEIVTAFNGKPVTGPDQFASLIHGSAPGSTVTLTVLRDGHSQDMKVKLGDWKQMAQAHPLPPIPHPPLNPVGNTLTTPGAPPMAALPPRAYPEIDISGSTSISARHGVVVEPLSPQLGEFFGVPSNQGILVRSVEKGSPGSVAGLKAGDVIVRVNDETIHDIVDWKRALKGHSGKVTVVIIRDKREQTVQMSVPANTSELNYGDWSSFDREMQSIAEEMKRLGPELERNAQEMAALAQMDQSQFDEIHRQAEAAAKAAAPEMKKQAEEMRKQAEQMRKEAERAGRTVTPEMKKQAEEMRKQAAEMRKEAEKMRKDVEKMTPEMARTARDMAEAMKPTAKEMAQMAREMQQTWKEMQPELKLDMEQLKKEIEQEKREWQEIFKGSDSPHKM